MSGARRWTTIEHDRAGAVFLGLIVALAIAAPVLNQLVPASSPFHLSTYSLTLIGKYAMAAIGLMSPAASSNCL